MALPGKQPFTAARGLKLWQGESLRRALRKFLG